MDSLPLPVLFLPPEPPFLSPPPPPSSARPAKEREGARSTSPPSHGSDGKREKNKFECGWRRTKKEKRKRQREREEEEDSKEERKRPSLFETTEGASSSSSSSFLCHMEHLSLPPLQTDIADALSRKVFVGGGKRIVRMNICVVWRPGWFRFSLLSDRARARWVGACVRSRIHQSWGTFRIAFQGRRRRTKSLFDKVCWAGEKGFFPSSPGRWQK